MVMGPTRLLRAALLFISATLIACQHAPMRTNDPWQDQPALHSWQGRLALRIDGPAPQSLQAHFELATGQQRGQLRLSSPLGTTLAEIVWQPGQAQLLENGRIHHAQAPEQLLEHITGQSWPMSAWQAWLQGENQQVPGWELDLTEHAQGKLTARRTAPSPTLQLRLVFEQQAPATGNPPTPTNTP
jgi:outer membrane lipoprotein LolB